MAEAASRIERRLFAIQLVDFLYEGQGCDLPLYKKLPPAAEFAYKAFDKTMQKAVTNIEFNLKIQLDVSEYMMNIYDVNVDTYQSIGRRLIQKYFPNGFNYNTFHNFLPFCVYVAIASAYFYERGVIQAPNMAVRFICALWKDNYKASNKWEALKIIAERYASMSGKHPDMTMESTKILSSDQAMPGDSAYQNAAENVGNAKNGNSIDVSTVMCDDLEKNEEDLTKSSFTYTERR